MDQIRKIVREALGAGVDTITVYHGTHNKKESSISSQGLKASKSMGYDNAGWYVVSTDFESALFHATPEEGLEAVVFEFEVPVTNEKWEGFPYFWPPHKRDGGSKWFALKEPLPADMIKKVHKVPQEDYLNQKNKGLNEEVIEETQEGQKDLEEFTNDILMLMSEESVKMFEDYKIYYGEENSYLPHFPTFTTAKMGGEKYDEISEFVEETSIEIAPTTFIDKEDTEGRLSYASPQANMGREVFIIKLKYSKDDLKEVNKLLIERPYGEVKPKDIYFKLYYIFYSTLLHELQHAYDAWRSKGKAFSQQTSKKYTSQQEKINQIEKKSRSELTPEEIRAMNDGYKAYLNLTHEINARFAQAMQKARFKTVDDEWNDVMKPWNEAFRSFKINFRGWDILSDKMTKRLANRFAKAYQYESENLKTAVEKYGKEDAEEIKSVMAEEVRKVLKEVLSENDGRSFDFNYMKSRIPFLNNYDINYAPDHYKHPRNPTRIEAQRNVDVGNTTIMAGGDMYTFPKVFAMSEFAFYTRKRNDDNVYVFSIDNKIVPWQPENMSDFTYKVLMKASGLSNENMSEVVEVVMPEGETIPDDELNAAINKINKKLFKFEEKTNDWQIDFF